MDSIICALHDRTSTKWLVALCGFSIASTALFVGLGLVVLADSPKVGTHRVSALIESGVLICVGLGADLAMALFFGPPGRRFRGIWLRLLWSGLATAAGIVVVSVVVSGGRWIF
jgi:hypothetical protein